MNSYNGWLISGSTATFETKSICSKMSIQITKDRLGFEYLDVTSDVPTGSSYGRASIPLSVIDALKESHYENERRQSLF